MKREYWFLILIFLVGFAIRFLSVWPSNTVIGFDQARDLFDSVKIMNGNLRIIGPTAGNNPNLHHGVAWIYFMIPPLLFGHNPIFVVIWNSLFNAGSVIFIFFIAKSLFKDKKISYIASIISAVSFYYVQFSGWLSNPTGTFFSLPLFILGLVEYYRGKKWGLPLAFFFLGITIQFELFFLYMIPTGIVLWLILKPKLPSIKLCLLSIAAFLSATSTMIATEIKYNFSGVKSILTAGQLVGDTRSGILDHLRIFLESKWEAFYLNFWPQNKDFGTLIGMFSVLFLAYEIIKHKKKIETVKINLFLLVLFFSPAIMFILGVHNAPWFYIGRPASAILIGAYILSKLKANFLIAVVLLFIVVANLTAIKDAYGLGQPLLEPDKAAILSKQVEVMEYTYKNSGGKPFAINTVTNPLYVNLVWAWNYNWYSKSYGYKPNWLGGDQLPPYNTLETSKGDEELFYLIIDQTPRIPGQYITEARNWANKNGELIKENDFDGITVEVYKTKQKQITLQPALKQGRARVRNRY